MASITDIIWSPNHEDRFSVVFKNIIFLFKITDFDGAVNEQRQKVKVIGGKYKFKLTLLNAYGEPDSAKAFAWKPCLDIQNEASINPPYLVAVGLSSGNVKLSSLQNVDPRQDQFGLNNKELISHANRYCAFLHWNPWRTNLLAQGLDRGRHNRAPSVLVWDVVRETGTRQPYSTTSSSEFANGFPGDSLYNMDKFAVNSYTKNKQLQVICDRPLCDACQNENAVSFTWVSKNSFVVGLLSKHIKLYDISDTAKTIQVTQTRLVHSLTSDPLFPTRFASFYQNQIGLWCSDNLEKPIYVFTERKNVVCIKWSHLREGWLGVLLADSTDVRVYNAQATFIRPMEECEQFLFELRATTSSEKSETPLVSFAWHGSIVNCIITIDRAGCLNVAKVHELTAVTWSPNHTLLWTCGSTWLGLDRTGLFGPRGYVVSRRGKSDGLKTSSNLNKSIIDGFTKVAAKLGDNLDSVIQRRADAGYGLEVQNTPYSAIVADDPQLRSLWVLIEYLQEYIEDWAPPGKCHDTPWGGVRGRVGAGGTGACDLRCQGAMAILCSGKAAASEVAESCEWHGIDASLTFPRYSSPERSRILRMCMWPLDASSDAQRRVFESVCGDMEFERAAAMALINLQFDWALSFLSRASECRRSKENGDAAANEADRNGASLASASSALSATETDLTGLALSGFSDPRNQFWRSTCADVLARLNNPYLRFMFKFLTCSRGDRGDIKDFKEILENEDLILIDRLAFACLYLNDQELRDYVRSTFEHMLQGGRLEAVLLTGLSSPEFFDLLQRYVDLTSDVQTAAILGLHACSLCRYPTPGPPIGSSLGVRRGSGQSQASNRFRVRSGKDVGDTTKSTPSTPPGDQLVAKLGGRRLTNWVESYRDLLDRWRMWFYRVDFDNYYSARIVNQFAHGTASSQGATKVTSTSPNASRDPDAGNEKDEARLLVPAAGVRGVGLPAAANQIFVACIYCGWRLGGIVRGNSGETTRARGGMISTASGGGGGGGFNTPAAASPATISTSMHAGGGKQTICWHCLKPLPRCSICLMHMGSEMVESEEEVRATADPAERKVDTASEPSSSNLHVKSRQSPIVEVSNGNAATSNTGKPSAQLNFLRHSKAENVSPGGGSRGGALRLASWFVWCQACRHGGHAGHIFDWFYHGGGGVGISPTLIECPVNGCPCRCAGLDSSVPQPRLNPKTIAEPSLPTPTEVVHEGAMLLQSSISSEPTEVLPSDGEALEDGGSYDDVEGPGSSKRSSVAPASVPKNRREIVDPMIDFLFSMVKEEDEADDAVDNV